MSFESEVAGIKEVDFGVRVVAFESPGTGRQEKGIVLAHTARSEPPRVHVLHEFGVERDITLVIAEQIELDKPTGAP